MSRFGNKIRVLVVDDDPSMVETLRDILEASGFWVDAAYSGPEAIKRVQQAPPACVLMDIRMPGLNGVSTFREIKRKAPNCNVIFMTAYAASELVDQAHQEGAVEVLPKPLDLERMIHLISETTTTVPILVVGDEQTSQRALGDCFNGEEFEVRFAHNVDEAILLFGQEPWRAVIVDMEYGARIGEDGLRVIRDLDPQASMILLSGMAGLDTDSQKSLESIATTYFSRSASVEDVVEKVRKILAHRRVEPKQDPPRLTPKVYGEL